MLKNFASVKEYVSLFFINLKVKVVNCVEYFRVVFHYYSNISFLKADSYLVFLYLFNSPFTVSKNYLLGRGEKNLYTYGETPLTTLEYIARECRLSSKDKVFELGCGRGRTCIWLNQFIGCSVVGIDFVPTFIQRANETALRCNLSGVQFREEDILQSDLSGATVIYLYGTCYSTSFIQNLIQRFKKLARGTKIITISYALSDYTSEPLFEVMKRFPARFTWGEADVYLQIKR